MCLKEVSSDGKCMVCCECGSSYHLGSCAGIKESTYTTMGAQKRAKWRCRTCRSADSASARASVYEESEDDTPSDDQFSVFNAKLDLLLSMKATVDKLVTLPAKVDELLTLKPAVQILQETIQKIQVTVDDLSTKYHSVLVKATENEKNVCEIQAHLTEVVATVKEQECTIQQLRGDVNYLEQRSRSTNLEIHGLPHNKGEKLELVVAELAVKLHLPPLQETDVLAIHRLSSKRDVVPAVLIRFSSAKLWEAWMGCRGQLRALNRSGDLPKIYFNENLTRVNRELHWLARTKAKEVNFKFVWVRGGKIFAKKEEGAPLIRVNVVDDVKKIQ